MEFLLPSNHTVKSELTAQHRPAQTCMVNLTNSVVHTFDPARGRRGEKPVNRLLLTLTVHVYIYLSAGSNSFMTTHTVQSEALDDLTPSVFSVKEILLGLLKNECFLYSRTAYTSEMILEWYNTSFFWYVSFVIMSEYVYLCKITIRTVKFKLSTVRGGILA